MTLLVSYRYHVVPQGVRLLDVPVRSESRRIECWMDTAETYALLMIGCFHPAALSVFLLSSG